MFEELAVGAALLITWRTVNDESLTRARRKAALVALVLNQSIADVLLETLQVVAAAAAAAKQ